MNKSKLPYSGPVDDDYIWKKRLIAFLLAILLIILLIYFSGGITGMVIDPGFTTTTILPNGTISDVINVVDNVENDTTITTILTGNETTVTTTMSGGGGGGSPTTVTTSVSTVITSTIITTTTIFEADNDTMGTGNYTCIVNETVGVDVWLNTQGAYGAQFTVYYDNSLLEMMEVLNGTYFPYDGAETYWFNLTNNTAVLYAETRVNSTEDRAGNDVLSQILFKCLIDGSSVLDLQNVKVVDYSEQYLNISVNNGIVLIE